MKKYEVLYDWAIVKIAHLCDSAAAQTFADALQPVVELDEFTQLTEQIRHFGADLATAKQERALFAQWSELRASIATFEQRYVTFPDAEPKKFQLSLILCEKLALSLPGPAAGAAALDETDIDDALFEVRKLGGDLPVVWFVHQNAKSFPDSVLVMDCADLVKLAEEVANGTIHPDLLFSCLATLQATADPLAGHIVFVKRLADPISDESVGAFAKLAILASGQPIHRPYTYAVKPSVLDPDAILAGEKYQQLSDVLDVLSEYNSRDELLAKYLTLYHVIENFMFRFPIVQLEREHNGRMFTIRDFKRLYKQIDQNELAALKRLFDTLFKVDAKPGTTFSAHIKATWKTATAASKKDIEDALALMPMRKDNAPLKAGHFTIGGFSSHFAETVYTIRNAIVHNKETEFHLTYATLGPPMRTLLERFLVPSLEELCFALVGTQNTHVWYANQQLLLYK
jgi:hypothetical protein